MPPGPVPDRGKRHPDPCGRAALSEAGAHCFLVGESLMRQPDVDGGDPGAAADGGEAPAARARASERPHPFRRRRQRGMVDVSGQAGDRRAARPPAPASSMRPETLALIAARRGEEGRRAGRRAARRHHGRQAHGRPDPALPSAADLRRDGRSRARRAPRVAVEIAATVRTTGRTGVEMEALTAASVAALTVYDMCKAVDRGMRIEAMRVVAQGRRQVRRVRAGLTGGADDQRRRGPGAHPRAGCVRRRPRSVALADAWGRVTAATRRAPG